MVCLLFVPPLQPKQTGPVSRQQLPASCEEACLDLPSLAYASQTSPFFPIVTTDYYETSRNSLIHVSQEVKQCRNYLYGLVSG